MATTAELLAEAQAALHRLQIGEAAAEVRDADGSSIRYTQANISRLKQYVAELKAQAGGTQATFRRPMRPVWG